MDENYVKNLESIIKQMMKPLKNVPLQLVIEAMSGKKIIPFDSSDPMDSELKQDLIKVAVSAGTEINDVGIESQRANEVGNYIEPFLQKALNAKGLKADTPLTTSGKRKSTDWSQMVVATLVS